MGQWDQWRLWTAGTQVQSLTWCSRLRIQCGIGHNCDVDLTPGLGTLYAFEVAKKKKRQTFCLMILSHSLHGLQVSAILQRPHLLLVLLPQAEGSGNVMALGPAQVFALKSCQEAF